MVAGTRAIGHAQTLPGLPGTEIRHVRIGSGAFNSLRVGMVHDQENYIALQPLAYPKCWRRRTRLLHRPALSRSRWNAGATGALNQCTRMVLLDNMGLPVAGGAHQLRGNRTVLEISGGVTLDGLRALARRWTASPSAP
jgi:nicotinate-nucleotide pyrophosphorylase (carboxylating)